MGVRPEEQIAKHSQSGCKKREDKKKNKKKTLTFALAATTAALKQFAAAHQLEAWLALLMRARRALQAIALRTARACKWQKP